MIQSRRGDINITHGELTSRDKAGNRLEDSSIVLDSARDLTLKAGEDRFEQQGNGQNMGLGVGTAVSMGAKTGWSFYGKVGYGENKQQENGTTYQNSLIDTSHLSLNSQGNTTLEGATALAKRIDADIGKNLTITSLQDKHTS